MTVNDLRQEFLGYFEGKQHQIRPSAPLITDDPTTLFTAAGVQPYVRAFRGEETPPAPRVVSCQKCARMGDLDAVGAKPRYHTFFEMLGNFSFGDYFKELGVEYAWEFLTVNMKMDPADMWITIFETDDEAEQIWHKNIGVPMDRIVRLGREDNWWPKDRWEGPCGPCTEVHIDLGPELTCDKPDCAVGCDCNRYLELWNVVFQQFTEAEDGTLTPLPAPGVDTGLGLERLAMVMQNKVWSGETNELAHIMARAEEALAEVGGGPSIGYGTDPQADIALRVIADHTRAISFLMADGATPSNEGAGYILRRLIRRAHRFGRSQGATQPFLHAVLPAVVEACGGPYAELLPKADFTARVVQSEEERFGKALGRGLHEFDEIRESLEGKGETVIPGDVVFDLQATFGLPVEVTEEIASDVGLTVDREGFEAAMAAHGKVSSAGVKGLAGHSAGTDLPATEFVGDETLSTETEVLAVETDGDAVRIIVRATPLYAERGGQVGDAGVIETASGARADITNTTVGPAETFVHEGTVSAGTINVGDTVTARVEGSRRREIMRHHTATHLLQSALRQILGEHVTQQGSLVAPDRLRFDFTHHEAVSAGDLAKAEDLVNEWILADLPVTTETKAREDAIADGAIALFGEKYEDQVRVVKIGSESTELCGGTHCPSTGTIGAMRIVSEGSAAANVRRVEAVTGMRAVHRARAQDQLLQQAAHGVGCRPDELPERIDGLRAQLADAKKAASQASAAPAADVAGLLSSAAEVGAAKLVAHRLPDDAPADALKALADDVTARADNAVVVIAAVGDKGKVRIVAKVSDPMVEQGAHAGNLVREVAKACGGGGGGKPQFAEAGGRDASKIDEALALAATTLADQLGA